MICEMEKSQSKNEKQMLIYNWCIYLISNIFLITNGQKGFDIIEINESKYLLIFCYKKYINFPVKRLKLYSYYLLPVA